MSSVSLPSFWLSRPNPPEERATVVVGGGIVGLSTAYWLAKAGRQVTLVEGGNLAGRASGRNAGFLMTGSAEPYTALAAIAGERPAQRFWETSRENRELLRAEILDAGKVDCEFLPEGSWLVATSAEQEEVLRRSAERLAALGFELEWRDAAEVARASGGRDLLGGFFQPRDGGLDPVRLCRGLARLATAAGAEIRTGWSVRALEPAGGGDPRVRLVSDAGEILAERLVVAVNAYAAGLFPSLATEIHPVRGQMFATAPTAPAPRDLQGVWYINEGYEYLRQLSDGTLVVGGCRWVARDVEVGTAELPTATVQGALETFLAETFPGLAGRPVARRWAGTMALTANGLPRIGDIAALPGFAGLAGAPAALYAVGFNGHGMSLGFATGRHLARRAAGEDVPALFS